MSNTTVTATSCRKHMVTQRIKFGAADRLWLTRSLPLLILILDADQVFWPCKCPGQARWGLLQVTCPCEALVQVLEGGDGLKSHQRHQQSSGNKSPSQQYLQKEGPEMFASSIVQFVCCTLLKPLPGKSCWIHCPLVTADQSAVMCVPRVTARSYAHRSKHAVG